MTPATLLTMASLLLLVNSSICFGDPVRTTVRPPGHHRKTRPFGAKPKEYSISVGGVGNSAEIRPELAERLRVLITQELEHTPGIALQKLQNKGFLIDSAITHLSRTQVGDNVEVSCEISLIVGRLPSRALVMTTSGGATVQIPKSGFRPEHEQAMNASALAGAVRGARENLVAFLARQP